MTVTALQIAKNVLGGDRVSDVSEIRNQSVDGDVFLEIVVVYNGDDDLEVSEMKAFIEKMWEFAQSKEAEIVPVVTFVSKSDTPELYAAE